MCSLYILCVICLVVDLQMVCGVEMSKALTIPSAEDCGKFRTSLCGMTVWHLIGTISLDSKYASQ